ncbi:DUF805 domain-containing protein [Acerihabitans sp. TG2]|uniref:DUF805 domain-containing protein n=1 Tax=Acerihabitans sp. TG2 TaxID=3096008 RepID=UPI002B234DE2|nr:DUF805 domain-containing protein [Acerihabitans sp. TG2]MEA9393064.1 DUF805 domain-containing protein [Acerihabitans sp. TG2]
MRWYIYALKKYFTLEGRAGRAEFWYFNIIHFLISILLFMVCVSSVFSSGTVSSLSIIQTILPAIFILYYIATIPPNFALQVRRLHDVNYSGWFLLVSLIPFVGIFILLIFFCRKGTPRNNTYGPVVYSTRPV